MTDSFIPSTPLEAAMANGHRIRTGHELRGYYITGPDGVRHLVRTCACADIKEIS